MTKQQRTEDKQIVNGIQLADEIIKACELVQRHVAKRGRLESVGDGKSIKGIRL